MQPVNISDTGYQMFLDDESVFAPRERGLERQAKQNALARQQAVRNALAANIDPATGRTNWQNAYAMGGQDVAPELQGMQQADLMAQAELSHKRGLGTKANLDAQSEYWKQQRDTAARIGDQSSWSTWRSTLPGEYQQFVPEQYSPENQRMTLATADKALEMHFQQVDTGPGGYTLAMPKMGGPAVQVPGSNYTTTPTIGETETQRHNREMEANQRQQEARQGTPDPIKLRREATTLRKEFDALPEVKDFKAALPVLMSARNAPDTAAGDIDLAYAVGKIYDPKSVVRESEQKLVYTTGSVLQKLIGGANVALTGGTRLPSEVRQKLLNALNNRVLQFRQAYDQTRGTYEGYANQSGFDPVNVIGQHPAIAYKGQSSAVVQVITDADYNKLPSGTLFVGPDGKQRRKP